ncbi:LysM peptidoglycan-binding domain-containing protein [Amaricoccus sp.]|uniref:LysM peptidoglycan-binding domain-containing protein n=1 Tax=Amaricoccus sp. TaxID=1872485 RepID=UPI001B5802CF|nr:Ig-like domain-containing protein [Amaricoccus sp.]MBP7000096.1 LysM peptidoglycan-binding domain-containing protein [Amaricoccus sp.]
MALPVAAIAISVALAAAATGAVVLVSRRAAETAPPAASAPVVAAAPAPAAVPPEPAAPVGAAPAAPEPAAVADAPAAPSLDVVRVTPEGSAVVAGRAEPGATVTLRTEDGTVAETEADAAGEFVAVFETTPSTEPRTLTVESETPEGVRVASSDVVVLLPEPPPLSLEDPQGFVPAAGTAPEAATDGAAAAPEGTEVAAAGAPEAGASAPGAPEAEAPGAVEAGVSAPEAGEPEPGAPAGTEIAAAAAGGPRPRVAATAVVRGGDVEVRPTEAGPRGLTLASVSYAGEGDEITLAGLGAAGARLRAYVDDRFARDGAVGADGRWTLALGDVAAGVHRLRIDAVRDDGTVEARLETPFQRDIPAAAPAGRPGTVTVQPGGNLWTIARTHYGSGVLYTRIYTANRELIRDPALIYPGQIFVLPEGETDR